MDVLLVNSNWTQGGRVGYGSTPAPAGLISLAGVLRRAGHNVAIRQATQHVVRQDQDELPLVREELRAILDGFPADVIGISVRNVGAARRPRNPFRLIEYYSAFYDERLVRAFRGLTEAPIILGGTAFSVEPGLYMKYARPDYAIMGEAEESLVRLLDALSAGEEPAGIEGLVRTYDDTAPEKRVWAHVPDLSVVGAGACDAVADFRRHYYEAGGLAPIQTKRGCDLRCIYCTAPSFEGSCFRFRPMDDVISEIRAYGRDCGVRHFFLADSTLNRPIEHALEFCEAILAAGLDIEWYGEVAPGPVTDELCDLMKRSGCIGVSLGPDACSERVLAAYRKGIGMADVAEAVRLLRRHDIPFETCIILGGPGETRETVGESIEFCAENLADEVVRFYDGMVVTSMSGVYDIAVAEGLVDPDRRYEDIILENDFRAMKGYEYFFPHVQEGRDELLEFVDRGTQRPRWLLTSRDYKPDPGTGGLALVPEKAVSPGSRPWWRDLGRAGAPVSEGVGDA